MDSVSHAERVLLGPHRAILSELVFRYDACHVALVNTLRRQQVGRYNRSIFERWSLATNRINVFVEHQGCFVGWSARIYCWL